METLERGTLINAAAIAGAALGLVSGAYIFITCALGAPSEGAAAVGSGLISSVLWMVKLVVCIWIMRWGMVILTQKFDGVTNRDTRTFGLFAAAFSALITAAANYVAYEFAFPEYVDTQLDAVYQLYGGVLDSNSMDMLDKVTGSFSIYSFFSTLFWCFIYGAVLTSILSSRIPVQDPQNFFDDVKKALAEAERQSEEEASEEAEEEDEAEEDGSDSDNEDEE